MLLPEKESSELIFRIEKIFISNGEPHHNLLDLRKILDKLFKVLCEGNANNEKLTTNERIKYIFNNFPEHRMVRKEADGLRMEFNEIAHDNDSVIKVSEKDVLRCANDLKHLISNFSKKKRKRLQTEYPFDYWYSKGEYEQDTEDYQKALVSYTEALKFNSQSEILYLERGFIYQNLKKYHESIQDYTKAIELSPSNTAYFERGRVYEDLKQYDEAIADYTQAIKFFPDHVFSYFARGYNFYKNEQYNKAISDYTKVIEFWPKFYLVYYLRGYAYEWIDQLDKAKADLVKAIELESKLRIKNEKAEML